jgi:serine/threonine protein kinase
MKLRNLGNGSHSQVVLVLNLKTGEHKVIKKVTESNKIQLAEFNKKMREIEKQKDALSTLAAEIQQTLKRRIQDVTPSSNNTQEKSKLVRCEYEAVKKYMDLNRRRSTNPYQVVSLTEENLYGHYSATLYLLMNPCITLSSYMKDHTPGYVMQIAVAQKLMEQLHEIHSLGIIHLDIKGDNILLTNVKLGSNRLVLKRDLDSSPDVYLADFGASRFFKNLPASMNKLTMASMVPMAEATTYGMRDPFMEVLSDLNLIDIIFSI